MSPRLAGKRGCGDCGEFLEVLEAFPPQMMERPAQGGALLFDFTSQCRKERKTS